MSEVETKDIVAELEAWWDRRHDYQGDVLWGLVQRARDEVVAVCDQLTESANRYEEMLGDMNHEANAAKRDRAEARAEALEEAARRCDERAMTGNSVTNHTAHSLAAAIRALKDKP